LGQLDTRGLTRQIGDMEAGSGVVGKIQSTLLNNRVKIMRLCDYFAVSAPMIARRILPLEKHREIKLSAGSITTDGRLANNARMDALLDFVDGLYEMHFYSILFYLKSFIFNVLRYVTYN